jgi:hypothetical protein
MPGGSFTQSFSVPAGVSSLTGALVQIDPGDVTAHLTLLVNGTVAARADAGANGDTRFSFAPVGVNAGATVTVQVSFTATYGTIVTVYTVDSGSGGFNASNSCPAGAPSGGAGSQVLRAQITGMSS